MNISIFKIFKNSVILKNFSVLTVSNIFSQMLGIVTSIKIARSIDPVSYGQYNLLQLHIATFVIIASLGIKNIVVRTVARDKQNTKKIYLSALALRSLGLIVSIVAYSVYHSYTQSLGGTVFFLTLLGIVSMSTYDIVEGVVFGLEKMEFTGTINLINSFVWVAIILLIPSSNFNLNTLFEAYVGLNVITTCFYLYAIYKYDYLTGSCEQGELKTNFKHIYKQALPYYYLALLTLLSNQLPVFFLSYRSGAAQVGFYNLANKILSPLGMILNTALVALFPNLAQLFTSDIQLFIKRVKNIFLILSLLGIMGAFGVTFFLKEIMLLMYGPQYIGASYVLGYQCWYMALYALVCLIGTLLGAIDRQKQLSYLSIVCTLFQVPILWVGAKYGAQYLSAAFLVSTCISLVIHIVVIKKYLTIGLPFMFFGKIIALFIVAYSISILMLDFNLIFKAIVFTIISGGSAFLLHRKYQTMRA